MNLYTFSKNAWHVRFFKWLFKSDPTQTYKTMCPYFWTYVFIFIFIVPILIIKLFGRYGTKFLNWTKDYKENKIQKAKDHLVKLCINPNMTPKEAYNLRKSKCFKLYAWDMFLNMKYPDLTWELDEHIRDLYNQYIIDIEDQNYKLRLERSVKRDARIKKYEEYKEYKWFTYLSYTISAIVIGALLYTIGYVSYQGYNMINWPFVGHWTRIIGFWAIIIISVISIIWVLFKYIFMPFVELLSCIKLPTCGICKNLTIIFKYFIYLWIPFKYIFIGIFKFFAIIGDMIYSTYKKKCPIITWEDK